MNLLKRLSYKITHLSKFPKGNLVGTFRNLAARGFHPNHIVDIGANRGKWSRDAWSVFPEAGYTLIEPQIEMKAKLDRFCAGKENCHWLQAGAGAKNGILNFTVCPDTVSSSFKFNTEQARKSGYEQRQVPVFTLDHIVENHVGCIPDVVKVDAEGFEYNVLLGASKILGKTELIFLETHLLGAEDDPCSFVNLTREMSRLGYAPYDFTWFGRLPRHKGAIGLCEVAYALKDGFLRNTQNQRAAKRAAA
jgi:FkbM family methyltransferase